ncbi:uncharacterized protein SCHCODRAFT_02639802 [Schizophyllum commune H4-8]|uniref:uncharacterized protein n=1 Tax=Schizophyllum commune (strain H4-8 / FGSC 9210) TaxID=578458 RepID=UPI00215E9082|nr:uncharacterized protein SCHCODRAFT_02639802 [Schizophyllum commune H4-8]KAI5886779.1 hypothetical protein SCHCODRAFT_02639802 [Schizophyllum commune H4-8]
MREAEGAQEAANWKLLTLKYLCKDDNTRHATENDVVDALVPILRASARVIAESVAPPLSDGAAAIVSLTEEIWHDTVHFDICSQELDLTLPRTNDPYLSAEMPVEEEKVVEGEKVAAVALRVTRRAGHAHSHALMSAKVLVGDTARRLRGASG